MIGKIKTIRAFTLIELLMVISIISLLSSIVLGYVGSARAKSRDAVRLNDMQQINTAASIYRDDKNEVPDSIEMLVNTGYLSAVPKDPSTGIAYSSRSISTSKGKVFMASTTYETIKRDDGTKQSVGVIVGDLTLEDICLILSLTDTFPNCSGNNPTDQIVGLTRGSRSGGGNKDTSLVWSDTFEMRTWYDSVSLCSYWGGRLPMIEELKDAINNQNNGVNNPGGFSQNLGYWSSDESVYESAYGVVYYNGELNSFPWSKLMSSNFRCVK